MEKIVEESFQIIKKNLFNYYVLFITLSVISVLITVLFKVLGDPGLIGNIISLEIQVMGIYIMLKFLNGEEVEISYIKRYLLKVKENFSEELEQFFRYVGTSILFFFIVFLGIILLIIPGIIWGYKYRYSLILCIEEKLNPIEALKRSKEITSGHKKKMFVIDLMFFGINILGVLCLFVGLVFTIPLTAIGYFVVYRRLNPVIEVVKNEELDYEYEEESE